MNADFLGKGRHIEGTVLLVDDDPGNLLLLETILGAEGFGQLISTTDPHTALQLFDLHKPDLVVADMHMPGLNGITMLGEFRRQGGETPIPIILITADDSPEVKARALRSGASDFLVKPFDHVEIVLRISNQLRVSLLQRQLIGQNERLDERVAERTKELETARWETLERLAIAGEYRDDSTGQHAQRVGDFAGRIALGLGLSPQEAMLVQRAATLHDLGKIAIPDEILRKPAALTKNEFELVKTHTQIGARILSGSDSAVLKIAEKIAATHHERWDGRGYEGMTDSEIPLEGRIVALADSFDAMTTDRPYRAAMPEEDAVEEVRAHRGQQFDPTVVDAFLATNAGQPLVTGRRLRKAQQSS